MIRIVSESIFDLKVEMLVNPVNCVGVMGKGLAKQFKERYPTNDLMYRMACNEGIVQLGKPQLVVVNQVAVKYICNFPTKGHWREYSELKYVKQGLKNLKALIKFFDVGSVGMPALGCGLGGLNWEDVRREIEMELSGIEDVKIIVCRPN